MRSYDMMMHRSGGDDGERKGEWKNNAVVGSCTACPNAAQVKQFSPFNGICGD